jgi:flagellar motility protein MotE (MotC chaperone)
MAEKEIALLKEQIARLDEKNFDLEAWKNHTIIFLERIFGKDSSKLKMIKELHYDYSSWSLRDTAAAGKTKDKDPVRMQADEILRATVAELESLGLPENKKGQEKIRELLRDELTGKQVKEIETLVNSENPAKTEKIAGILEKLDKENLALTIARLLTA